MRKIIYVLILIIVISTILFLSSNFLTIYYQVRGGNILSKISGFPINDGTQMFTCSSYYSEIDIEMNLIANAIKYYKKALSYNEDDPNSNLQLGRAYCYINKPELAVQYYKRYIKIRKDNPIGYLELGFAYDALLNECRNIPKCKSQTDYREAMLSAWKKSGVRVEDFLQAGDEQRRRLEFSSAQEWYVLGYIFNGESISFLNRYPDNISILEDFASASYWKPCEWCNNPDGIFIASGGILEMSYLNDIDIRDKFGYRMLQRIPLEDKNFLVLRVKGDAGTLITLEGVIDDERVRLISYQPVHNFWETLSVPINGDVFEEVTLFISEPDALSKIENYRIYLDWIGFKP